MVELNGKLLQEALQMLGERLRLKEAAPVRLVVCGGSALIALDLVSRSTRDVDGVAIVSSGGEPLAPVPLPATLSEALNDVATLLGLPGN